MPGASVGDVLPAQRVRDLPLVGGNILSLLEIMPGLRISPAGEQANTIGGLGINSINVTLNGMPTRDERFSPEAGVDLNGNPGGTAGGYPGGLGHYDDCSSTPISWVKSGSFLLLWTRKWDGETPRSRSQPGRAPTGSRGPPCGTSKHRAECQYSGNNNDIDSTTGLWNPTTPIGETRINTRSALADLSDGIKRFYALWDQQISRNRFTQENRVLTESARNGIFRTWEGWVSDSADPANFTTLPSLGANPTIPGVDVFGSL